MAAKNDTTEPAKLKFYVSASPADFVIEVPETWKLTFGAVNPGAEGMSRRDLHCLRVWEGTKLRAVFCDVRGIRDLGIPLMRKVEKETGSAAWTNDSAGNFERNEKREVSTNYRLDSGDVPNFEGEAVEF